MSCASSLIRVFTDGMKEAWSLVLYFWVHSEDSDQIQQMSRLIWVFTGCTRQLGVLSCTFEYTVKTVIRFNRCPGWSESSLVARRKLGVLSCTFEYTVKTVIRFSRCAGWSLGLTRQTCHCVGCYAAGHIYSKTCVKGPLKNRQNKDLNDNW